MEDSVLGSLLAPLPSARARRRRPSSARDRAPFSRHEGPRRKRDAPHIVAATSSDRSVKRPTQENKTPHPKPKTEDLPVYMTSNGRVDIDKVPRQLSLHHEFMSREEFRKRARGGRMTKDAKVSYEEKQHLFHSPYEPIYVMLAVGETTEQYEQRFVRWLETTQGITLPELEFHPIQLQERLLRQHFAALNARGQETFVPPTNSPKYDQEHTKPHDDASRPQSAVTQVTTVDQLGAEAKAAAHQAAPLPQVPKTEETCAGRDSVEACRACGCRCCLLAAMRQLSATILTLEAKAETKTSASAVTGRAPGAGPVSECSTDGFNADDATEQQLWHEFETLNEQIVMNERALDVSAAELVELVKKDIVEATRRHDEDDEMRELIQDEIVHRDAALTALLLYLYRNDLGCLETMVDTMPCSDQSAVQRLGYRKCAGLAVAIQETRARCVAGEYTLELDDKLRRLTTQRRRALETLVYFDQCLRDRIRSVLAQVKCVRSSQDANSVGFQREKITQLAKPTQPSETSDARSTAWRSWPL